MEAVLVPRLRCFSEGAQQSLAKKDRLPSYLWSWNAFPACLIVFGATLGPVPAARLSLQNAGRDLLTDRGRHRQAAGHGGVGSGMRGPDSRNRCIIGSTTECRPRKRHGDERKAVDVQADDLLLDKRGISVFDRRTGNIISSELRTSQIT
jgi:hypothetical protein